MPELRKGRFMYPGEQAHAGLLDVLRWKMTSKAAAWPEIPRPPARLAPEAPADEGVTATWVGQSTFLLRSKGATVITDPVFSERASPVRWLGPRRAVPPGIAFKDLPKVDLVLLSHDHYDHCDTASLAMIAKRDSPIVVAPLGHRGLLESVGFRTVIELNWWEEAIPLPEIKVTLTPSRHWCRRSPWGTNKRLWGGFNVHIGGRKVYFVGDSGYDSNLFKEIGLHMVSPDLALIPIGAYEPRWFMASAHMNPLEAILVHRDIKSKTSIAMHWGTFQLTDEPYDDPPAALERAKSPGEAFVVLPVGGSLSV